MSAHEFDGRVALITGAGRGLGRAYAEALAARGCIVVVNDVADDQGYEPHLDVVKGIEATGGQAFGVTARVDYLDEAATLVAAAHERFGRVDILINNAGFLRDRSFRNMSLADFDAVIDVHLRGAAYVTHACWPLMCGQDYGRILNTCSTSALYGVYGQANYDAAKMGLIGLQNALRIEGQRHGVSVNTIAPLAATRLSRGVFPDHALQLLELEWVVAVCLHLVSEACPHTGLVLEVGGGRLARVRIVENTGAAMMEPTPEAAAAALTAALVDGEERSFECAADAVSQILARVIAARAPLAESNGAETS